MTRARKILPIAAVLVVAIALMHLGSCGTSTVTPTPPAKGKIYIKTMDITK